MASPPNFEEGQSTYRPPRFNGQYYGWRKTRIHDFIMVEDSELWYIICDGPHVPMKKVGESGPMVPKTRKEYNDIDRKVVEENFRAKKILEALQTAHEGTTQVKQSKIDMLTTEYELFSMKDDESIQDMHTRFTSIINELHSLGEIIPRNKLVSKVLSVLPSSWESKVNVITEAKDLQTLTMDELIGNLKTYEMKRKKDSKRREPKKEKNLVLKDENNDLSEEESDMSYLTKRFQKMEHYKHNSDKAAKRNPVLDKRFSQKSVADNVVKQSLAAWGDSSGKSEGGPDAGNSSMMVVENEAKEYDSLFALMDQSDDDEDDDNDEVNFRDVQRNLKSYSSKKLMSLANVLIGAYYSLVNDKDALTIELGDAEQSRDDLVVCVVDLNEIIGPNREPDTLGLHYKLADSS
ncbi:structural maintenance of chromosomes protein 3-like [Nicotiana sylvestris]|uniref:structural maintenance of chromosomes protein 3-like n=1 Tax=Nicotiana sylvestris TaxID=4096 RepID=UPI00388CD9FE